MYRFAYLYVKLGYLLAGIVLGISVLFIGISIIVLELQKPRESAESFNRDFAELQERIKAQADTVQRVFGLDESLPALENLRSRQWNSTLVSLSSVARLAQEYDAALADVQSLRQAVLSQLEADIDFITGQLAPSQNATPKKGAVSPSSSAVPASLPDAKSLEAVYASTNTETFSRRIRRCDNALDLVRTLQAEARSTDNKAALSRAGGEIEKFLQIIRGQQANAFRPAPSPVPAPMEPSVAEPDAPERPTRRDHVREDLEEMLRGVQAAVTQDWNLDETLGTLRVELQKFEAKARVISKESQGLLRIQLFLLGIFLAVAVLAFFIAVGSDLVKAILDSAVWLSHIYTNTANRKVPGAEDGPPQ